MLQLLKLKKRKSKHKLETACEFYGTIFQQTDACFKHLARWRNML